MKKYLSLIIGLLLIPSLAFALGSGSGGTLPPPPVAQPPVQQPAPVPQPPPVYQPAPVYNPTPVVKPSPTPIASPTKVTTISVSQLDAPAYCVDMENLKDRIKCRLQKSEEDLEKEYSYKYMPEECRVLTDSKQTDCQQRYKDLQPCWDNPAGPDRIECVKKVLGIDKLVPISEYCANQDASCMTTYREKVYHLITFRFYDLEERVEDWYRDGKITLDATVDFIAIVVDSKVNFYKTTDKKEHVAIIKSLIQEWDKIVSTVK